MASAGKASKGASRAPQGGDKQKQLSLDKALEVEAVEKHGLLLQRRIGSGAFSVVYEASWLDPQHAHAAEGRKYAAKCLYKDQDLHRIEEELRFLRMLKRETHSRCSILEAVLDCSTHTIILMRYAPHMVFKDELLATATLRDVRFYMWELLTALSQCHASGIIHRDVKPDNFLYHRGHDGHPLDSMLIDFGLAQTCPPRTGDARCRPRMSRADLASGAWANKLRTAADKGRSASQRLVHSSRPGAPPARALREAAAPAPTSIDSSWDGRFPSQARVQEAVEAELERLDVESASAAPTSRVAQTAARAGTASFRPPEVLMRVPYQTTAIDVWSAGVIMGSLLTRRHPLFPYDGMSQSITAVASLLGWPRMLAAGLRLGKARLAQLPEAVACPRTGPALLDPLRVQVYRNVCRRLAAVWPDSKANLQPPAVDDGAQASARPAGSVRRGKRRRSESHTAGVAGSAAAEEWPQVPLPQPHSPAFAVYQVCQHFMLCEAYLHDDESTEQVEEAVVLLLRLLDPDPYTRITAKEALNSPFFQPIRSAMCTQAWRGELETGLTAYATSMLGKTLQEWSGPTAAQATTPPPPGAGQPRSATMRAALATAARASSSPGDVPTDLDTPSPAGAQAAVAPPTRRVRRRRRS